jgi:hypothetical protein
VGEHVSIVLVAWFVNDLKVVLGKGIDSSSDTAVNFLWMTIICKVCMVREDFDWDVGVSK